jgi:hypothetical protein
MKITDEIRRTGERSVPPKLDVFMCPICESTEYRQIKGGNGIRGPGGQTWVMYNVCEGCTILFGSPSKFSKKAVIPEVGDWITLKTDMPGIDGEAGKVLELDLENGKFKSQFFTEDDGDPSLEDEKWFSFTGIFQIIKNPRIIQALERDYNS